MKIYDENLEKLGIDLKNRLLNKLKKADMEKILTKLLSKKKSGELVNLMSDTKYFSLEELLGVLEKYDKKKFLEILDEPTSERDMAIPIVRELNKMGYKVSQEVPLPKVGKSRSRKMDVAGYKRRGLRKKVLIFGVELKSETSRYGIDKAFSQARDYQDYCEIVVVAFSPLMYLKYADVIEAKARREESLGVWIVGKTGILYRVKEPIPVGDVSDKYQRSIVEYIDSH